MNKEQLELLGEAYENYSKKSESRFIPNFEDGTMTIISPASHYNFLSQEKFINKIKTDTEFSEKWGLTIEERELSLEEREKIAITKYPQLNETPHGALIDSRPFSNEFGDSLNIPTKLITVTHDNETIESYE